MTTTVSHIFATLATGPRPADDTHPFVTYAVFSDGSHSQHTNLRDLRDCLVYGNGMAAAFMAAGVSMDEHNVVFDARFTRPA